MVARYVFGNLQTAPVRAQGLDAAPRLHRQIAGEDPACRQVAKSPRVVGNRRQNASERRFDGCEQTLLALGVAQLFDAAYGYDAVANPKPAPDTVVSFCDLTGLKPVEIAMVGDNRHDLEMARAGGCGLAVAVLSGTGTRESLTPLADVVLDSVAELPAWLEKQTRD